MNRIKRHTCFHGPIESGLAKMCAIGLGKHTGALAIHEFGFRAVRDTMPRVARRLLTCTNIVGGVAILENAYGGTAEIHGLTADEIGGDRERELLQRSRTLSPRLAFDDVVKSGQVVARIEQPDLARYYDALRLVTRGRLADPARLRAILDFQLGRYDGLVEAYVRSLARPAS